LLAIRIIAAKESALLLGYKEIFPLRTLCNGEMSVGILLMWVDVTWGCAIAENEAVLNGRYAHL